MRITSVRFPSRPATSRLVLVALEAYTANPKLQTSYPTFITGPPPSSRYLVKQQLGVFGVLVQKARGQAAQSVADIHRRAALRLACAQPAPSLRQAGAGPLRRSTCLRNRRDPGRRGRAGRADTDPHAYRRRRRPR